MAKIQSYKAKLNEDGTRYIDPVTNDFVTELVSEEEGPDEPILPDWLALEQSLRYSPLFYKAFNEASDKGFSLFMTTLQNGKRGDASENALSFAFSMLGVTWTQEETDQLNEYLQTYHFTITL